MMAIRRRSSSLKDDHCSITVQSSGSSIIVPPGVPLSSVIACDPVKTLAGSSPAAATLNPAECCSPASCGVSSFPAPRFLHRIVLCLRQSTTAGSQKTLNRCFLGALSFSKVGRAVEASGCAGLGSPAGFFASSIPISTLRKPGQTTRLVRLTPCPCASRLRRSTTVSREHTASIHEAEGTSADMSPPISPG